MKLIEGMIRLPSKTLKLATEKIIAFAVGHLITECDKMDKLIDIFRSFSDSPILTTVNRKSFTINIDTTDLPPKYKTVIDHNKELICKITLDWTDTKYSQLTKNNAIALYIDGDEKSKPQIIIGLKNLTLANIKPIYQNAVKSGQKKPELIVKDVIESFIHAVIVSFEHELTHFIQYNILQFLDDRNIHSANKDSIKQLGKRAAYYTSNIEFQPAIRSAIGRYITGERSNLAMEISGTRADWVKVFTCTKQVKVDQLFARGEDGGFVRPDDFFSTLKRVDSTKWKLAIKLFLDELNRKHPI